MLWCHSLLVRLVFEGSIPTRGGFHSENFFPAVLFWYCFFLGMVIEKRHGRVRERCTV